MAIRTGQVEMTGSAVQLTEENLEVDQLRIRGKRTNTDSIYLGDETVTVDDGYELVAPGEEFSVDNDNRSGEVTYHVRPIDVYLVGTSGDSVSWLAWVK